MEIGLSGGFGAGVIFGSRMTPFIFKARSAAYSGQIPGESLIPQVYG